MAWCGLTIPRTVSDFEADTRHTTHLTGLTNGGRRIHHHLGVWLGRAPSLWRDDPLWRSLSGPKRLLGGELRGKRRLVTRLWGKLRERLLRTFRKVGSFSSRLFGCRFRGEGAGVPFRRRALQATPLQRGTPFPRLLSLQPDEVDLFLCTFRHAAGGHPSSPKTKQHQRTKPTRQRKKM